MHEPTRFRRLVAVPMALALGSGLVLAACGDDDASPDDTTTTVAAGGSTTTEAAAGEELVIEAVWARTSPAMATAGAAYMKITNPTETDDVLVDVSVDPSVAGTAELHETSMAEGDGEGEMDGAGDDGAMGSETTPHDESATTAAEGEESRDASGGEGGEMMTMKEVEEIAVPAGETVVLEPGGYHVMLIDLVDPLVVGDKIEITLVFAEAGEVVVEAEVRDTAP